MAGRSRSRRASARRPSGDAVPVNVGQPREVEWRGRRVLTSIWKAQVGDRRWVSRLNVRGDAQADLAAHGGEHRAVYVYDLSAYRYWEQELGGDDFVSGQFGENFTWGLPDDEVCIGDHYRIGSTLFEVTQPWVTCYKIGLRMREPRMPALLYARGRLGFYTRVLEEREVGAGDADVVFPAERWGGRSVRTGWVGCPGRVGRLLEVRVGWRRGLEHPEKSAALADGFRLDSFIAECASCSSSASNECRQPSNRAGIAIARSSLRAVWPGR